MIIKSISKLSKFGIFENYTNTNVDDFGKYNLFYGWNGSGKSTLSTLFRGIESHMTPSKFPLAEFTLNIDGGSTITQTNISKADLNIYTFNDNFVDENIS